MSKKNPEPPPKEQRRFERLLKKLVAVPVSEIHEKRKEYRKGKRKRDRASD